MASGFTDVYIEYQKDYIYAFQDVKWPGNKSDAQLYDVTFEFAWICLHDFAYSLS